MRIETEREVLVNELKTVYFVEKKLLDNLDEIKSVVKDEELRELISSHCEETEIHVTRLETVFREIGHYRHEVKSPVIEALDSERESFEEHVVPGLRSHFYLNMCLTVERVEITLYERLIHLSETVELETEIEDLLMENLEDEKAALNDLRRLSNHPNRF